VAMDVLGAKGKEIVKTLPYPRPVLRQAADGDGVRKLLGEGGRELARIEGGKLTVAG